MQDVAQLLGPSGALAEQLPNYEPREGQLQMAEAVQSALDQEHILFCEAGTGTGKTLAYLIPAILSGRKVIVSTATRALQEQIFQHDIPLLERALHRPVSVAMLKGLGNYLCLRRYNELRSNPTPNNVSPVRLNLIDKWQAETASGDLGELVGLSEQDPLHALINSSSDTRLGSRCTYAERCYVAHAKREAEAAQIVVVNHHLFFADLALRGPHPGRVLPHYDAVIFDEAHQIEDVATLFFGTRVGRKRIQNVVAETRRILSELPEQTLRHNSSLAQASSAEERFFHALSQLPHKEESRTRIQQELWSGELYENYLKLDGALEGVESSLELARGERSDVDKPGLVERLDNVLKRTRQIRDSLASIVDGSPGRITWLDSETTPALSSAPVDLSEILNERVFNQIPTVILTSATLASGKQTSDPFGFVRKRLGAVNCETDVKELVVSSPFDFATRSLLYLPNTLPEPAALRFIEQASQEVAALVNASNGGAFVLTTSLRAMRKFHDLLRASMPDRLLLMQGTAPKHALLASFRKSEHAVLIATMGFWEGVDIPGRALRLVILDKIPFPVPTDPLVEARCKALEESGQNPFTEFFIPAAAIALKQGFGRLIRHRSDRGVVAILDARLQSKGYGKKLLSGLPPAPRTHEQQTAIEFLEQSQR